MKQLENRKEKEHKAKDCAITNGIPLKSGNKNILSIEDFTDNDIIAELRRRNFKGELTLTKILVV